MPSRRVTNVSAGFHAAVGPAARLSLLCLILALPAWLVILLPGGGGEAAATALGHEGLAIIAIGNLVDNAVRYGPVGGAVAVRLDRGPAGLAVSVSDEGPGIPAARREAAIRRFTRLESAAGEEGSGLGLSIVARIAELHGAALQLRNAPGGRGLEAALHFPPA